MLFEPEQVPRVKQVYGPNLLSLTAEQREKIGFSSVLPVSLLDSCQVEFFKHKGH